MPKKLDLDDATVAVMKRMLGAPPKPHNEMKVGRPKKEKKPSVKARASSSKRRSV